MRGANWILAILQVKGLDPSSVHVRFVVSKVAFGQVSIRVLRFSVVISINAPNSSNNASPESQIHSCTKLSKRRTMKMYWRKGVCFHAFWTSNLRKLLEQLRAQVSQLHNHLDRRYEKYFCNKIKNMRWAKYVAQIVEIINACKIMFRKSQENRSIL
jgi:hypothetical protein